MTLPRFSFAFIIFLLFPLSVDATETIHHDLSVILYPEEHRLEVTDTITLPERLILDQPSSLLFRIHTDLKPVAVSRDLAITFEGNRPIREEHIPMHVKTRAYRLSLPAGSKTFTVKYRGEIHHPVQSQMEPSARAVTETDGYISSDGVFLSGASYWYPYFEDENVSFTLQVIVPEPLDIVSQGRRTRHEQQEGTRVVRWESPEPQDEIYIIGGPFTEYSRKAGPVLAMTFLRQPDEALAHKYLEATVQYLEMYSKLLGPYPYQKFALVENFWETGFGMPSFTLLGPKVIRFPFILYSSYPHEIVHSWWGNSVFIDYKTGNWAEGLTTYLADHLMKEQRGAGAEYRQQTLQKYTDYVARAKDFPLTKFRSRHSAVTEAVGYGKTMMFFHMLRLQMGDVAFRQALQEFYKGHQNRRASFGDLEATFARIGGEEIRRQFEQWVHRTGAPQLRVSAPSVKKEEGGYRLTARVEQVQQGPAYAIRIPVAVFLEGQDKPYQTHVFMDKKRVNLELLLPSRPIRVDIDPEFDVFRRLDRNEIPPALSGSMGATHVLIVLPSHASGPVRRAFEKMARSWDRVQSGQIEIRWDNDLDDLPQDRGVWLLGWDNQWANTIKSGLLDYPVSIEGGEIRVGDDLLVRDRHTVVLTIRHASNPDLNLTWIATDVAAAVPGLQRKLPHYGKYSYLGFDGEEPTNIVKGRWPVVGSPMTVWIPREDSAPPPEIKGKLASRPALASLPPSFSQSRMLNDVRWLTRNELKGRGFGTAELDEVAGFIAKQFREAGLEPGGDQEGSYFQTWTTSGGPMKTETLIKNVVGRLPGTEPGWSGQSIVVGAHFDHLGLGWPDVHAGDEGKIHPGADDNASGVAVLLELARVLKRNLKPKRTVIFVAFASEEYELRGSRHYVEHQTRYPVEKVIGMVNLDTVGRLGNHPLTIFGAGSATEWVHIFRGASFVTGVPIQSVADDFGASDQKYFLDAGVPAVQLFSGVHLDYHRPTDTIDKIDPEGMVKVATVIQETVEYLAGRPEPLTSSLGILRDGGPSEGEPRAGRKVSLGTVPDFAYEGQGVRLSGVSPGSPVERAGLTSGDVIVLLGKNVIHDLRTFSDELKKLEPGQTVSITFVRNNEEHEVKVTVVAR